MVRLLLNTTFSNKRNFIKTKGLGNDRLSSLPGHLLSRILSELPTKDSVSTSVLSKSWQDLWLAVPALDLNINSFEDEFVLMEFIDRFMISNQGLDRFKLIYDVTYEHSHEKFVSWIDEVVQLRVRHLTVVNRMIVREGLVRMPLSLYSCATLVKLTLYCVVFDDPGAELVSLPCVKKMCLEGVKFGFYILETLTANFPILEDLNIITHPDNDVEVVCVCSNSLKIFKLESRIPKGEDPNVEIDAPKLEFMTICDYKTQSFVIHSIGPFAKVDIDIVFIIDYDDPLEIIMLEDFLTGLSTVSEMTISAGTLTSIYCYMEAESLPQFSNLSRLEALLLDSSWEILPDFLGCCMNLQSLVVEIDSLPEIKEIKLSPVPQCVLSSLEFVQLKTSETRSIMKLATYFMKNCALFQNCTFEVSGNIIKKIKEDSKEI